MLHDPKWEMKRLAKQTLLDAAQYLETHGWCQGALRHKGNVCLFGAIRAVKPCSASVEFECVERLRKVTGSSCSGYSIAGWNDAPGRTKSEVIAALKAAAK